MFHHHGHDHCPSADHVHPPELAAQTLSFRLRTPWATSRMEQMCAPFDGSVQGSGGSEFPNILMSEP